MTVIDAFNIVNRDNLWDKIYDYYYKDSIEFQIVLKNHSSNISEVKEKILNFFYKEINSLDAKINNNEIIVVSPIIENDILVRYDAFLYSKESKKDFSIIFCPWGKILGTTILQECIDDLSLPNVLSGIFDQMTFFGYSHNAAENRIEDINRSLQKAEEDIKNGKTYTLKEAFEQLGIEEDECSNNYEQMQKDIETNINKKNYYLNKII